MSKLLSRLFIFLIPVVLLHVLSLRFIAYVYNRDDIYKLDSAKNILLIGDSHVEMAINDSSLKHVLNLSQAGEIYVYNYSKLSKLLSVNGHVRTVIVGCGAHSFQKYMSNVFLKKTNQTVAKMFSYYHVLTVSDIIDIVERSPYHAVCGLLLLPHEKSGRAMNAFLNQRALTLKDMNWGCFVRYYGKLDKRKNEMGVATLKARNEDLASLWDWQIYNLHRIADLCRSKGVKVIFVRMPEHRDYDRAIEPAFQQVLKQQFSDVPFIDYRGMELPDTCYYNYDHLNCYGAIPMTDTFRYLVDTL